MPAHTSKSKKANPGFRFRQFFVRHDRCAMKVGTDGVLLGAWAPVRLPSGRIPSSIMDVGTGSGLIALMLAQRCPAAQITAIDISQEAYEQAQENFAASPWSARLRAAHSPLQQLGDSGRSAQGSDVYDLIVSNPPYFVDSLKNPDAARRVARHNDTLPFSDLMCTCAHLLAPDGILALIAPTEAEQVLQELAERNGLECTQCCYVHPKPDKPAKRVMMAWRTPEPSEYKQPPEHAAAGTAAMHSAQTTHLTLEDEQGGRSEAYQQLTKEFYL
ncbi:MAG: methyltransferase [Paludibacteraceae bacterium]|nr:methyltransferase [Paludibacteraceae bacterium]